MIPVSAELAAAIDAPARQIHVRLRVDWDRNGYGPTGSIDDLSAHLGTLTVDRSLAGAWPAGIEAAEGSAAAAMQTELVTGNPYDTAKHAAWWFSRTNAASPLAGKERLARPCTLDIGLSTSDGVQWVRRFTGTTRALHLSSADRTATLHALDGREHLRRNVVLPGVRANLVGLNATWLISYLLHQCGIAPSPPARGDAPMRLWLPMHACGQPFHSGQTGLVRDTEGIYPPGQPRAWWHRPGPFVPVPDLFDTDSSRYDRLLGGDVDLVGVRNPDQTVKNISPVAIELWWLGVRPRVHQPWLPGIKLYDAGASGSGNDVLVRCDVDGNGVMHTTFTPGQTGAPIYDLTGPQIPNDGAWHFIGWRITITPTVRTVTFKLDNRPDQTVSFGTATGLTGLHIYTTDITAHSPFAELQITGPNPSSVWLHQIPFTPAATIDLSTLELDAMPETQPRQAWNLLAEIAAAEQTAFGFNETGLFAYHTRGWLATPGVPVKTLTAQQSITDLDTTDAIDQVANDITVPYTPASITTDDVWLWRSHDTHLVPAGSTLDLWLAIADPAAHVDTDGWVYDSNPDNSSPKTYVTVARNPDGTGRLFQNITVRVPEWTPGQVRYQVHNANPFPVYLANEWHVPAAGIAGRMIRVDRPVGLQIRDAASVAVYGEQPYQAPANQWVQRRTVAAQLAGGLIADLATASPAISDLEIIADPRLQLGDRVRVVDRDGLALDGDYLITGINETVTKQGKYTMRLTARHAPN